MANGREDRSAENLTEEISQQRLAEYRLQGVVAQSRELTSLVALIAAGSTLAFMAPRLQSELSAFMREVCSLPEQLGSATLEAAEFRAWGLRAFHLFVLGALPVAASGFMLALVTSFAQIGLIFSFTPLTPDLQKLNPLSGLQRLLSLKQGVEALRLVLKLGVFLLAMWVLTRDALFASIALTGLGASPLLALIGAWSARLFAMLALVSAMFAGLDLFFIKRDYRRNLRMTKQEAKQEHREREGDPQIKARIRSVQREMARKRMMEAVKKADVLITNPTHIAVAIVYQPGQMAAPRVVAKGADLIAQRLKAIAATSGIPCVENIPLARTLYKSVKVNQAIPRALYQAVAEILAYVYRLKPHSQTSSPAAGIS